MEQEQKYLMLQYLDEEEKILGLPIDEFIPVAGIVFFFFISKMVLTGMIIAFLTVKIIRRFKKNQGKGFLFILAYWHGNNFVGQTVFPTFPTSTHRYWI